MLGGRPFSRRREEHHRSVLVLALSVDLVVGPLDLVHLDYSALSGKVRGRSEMATDWAFIDDVVQTLVHGIGKYEWLDVMTTVTTLLPQN